MRPRRRRRRRRRRRMGDAANDVYDTEPNTHTQADITHTPLGVGFI